MKLYENIRNLRIQNKWSQAKLAELTGYTDRSSIAKIESGLVDLSQTKIEKFARVFNVSPVDLMGFESRAELESEILFLFDKLDDDKKKATIAFLTALVKENEQ